MNGLPGGACLHPIDIIRKEGERGMAKAKKIGILIFLLALLIAGLCFYWGWQMPLMDLLPDSNWIRVRVWAGDDTSEEQEWEIEPPALEDILSAMEAAKVDRNDKDRHLGARYFTLLLYREESQQPTLLYIRDYGKLCFAVDYDLDNYRYYEHGEELYEALTTLTANCPVKE